MPAPQRQWSPARQFAEDALAEFLACAQRGETYEVEGMTEPVSKVMGGLTSAINGKRMREEVRAFQRYGHVFLSWK